MSSPTLSPARSLAAYRGAVEADLAQWVPAAVQAAAATLQSSALRYAVASDRERMSDVLSVLQARQGPFIAAMTQALRAEIDAPAAEAAPRGEAPARRRIELTLLDEDHIDEEIETARIVQTIESQAEWELSHLAALCSALAGREAISPEANPLRPSAVARAMRRSADGFGLVKPARLLLLRELGLHVGARLREAYARHAALLEGWGVQPLHFTVRATPSASAGIRQAVQQTLAARAAPPAPPSPGTPTEGNALARLVQWARQEVRPSTPGGELRLLGDARPVGEGGLDAETAVRVMERLFALLGEQTSLSTHARGLVKRLDEPARRLAAAEPGLWQSLDHPWWQLLDRVVSAGSVEGEDAAGDFRPDASLDRVVDKFAQAPRTDLAGCRAALAEADFAITGLLDERAAELAPTAAALGREHDRSALEHQLREQIVQQLRSTPAPAALRQFLVGPWAIALAHAALRHGEHAPPLRERAELVDHLIQACAEGPCDDQRASSLLDAARAALQEAELPPARIRAELADLEAVLRRPGPPEHEVADAPAEPLPLPHVIGLHDGLPTVPIDTIEGAGSTGAALDRRAWLDSLEPGDYCRLFLLERWMTAQLTWRSGNRSMFVFTSRHAGRVHSLTRRALEKLRAAGLAATIEHGQLIAQAMDTLTESRPMPA